MMQPRVRLAPPSPGSAAAVQAAAKLQQQPMKKAGGRYSRFVQLMKLVLPAIAVLVAATVVILPQLQERAEGFRLGLATISVTDASGQQVVNARYTGADAKKQPYTVTADTAAPLDQQSNTIALEKPKADITLENGTWIALSAADGIYARQEQILELSGGVNLFHDTGYEFRTPMALVDLTKGAAFGDQAVEGQGPFGTIRSVGFQVFDKGARIIFTGDSTLTLYPAGEAKR
jgi:lipopolysaccharide export system protein LptC